MPEQKASSSPTGDINTQNIFDEFSISENIGEEVKKIDEKEKKDIYYYLRGISKVLLVSNIVLFTSIGVSIAYIFIQNASEKNEYEFLNPICGIFLWKGEIGKGSCYNVTPILSEYEAKLSNEEKLQSEKIIPLLSQIYAIENFNFSQRTSFLLEKSEDRLRSLEVLSAFDEMKNKFAPTDRSEISCYDISISEWNILQLTCDAFSSDWDNTIVQLNEGSISSVSGWGTSISRASSFINFIVNYPGSQFQIMDKPTSLTYENVQNGPYTKKTTIQLQLRYTNNSHLSL